MRNKNNKKLTKQIFLLLIIFLSFTLSGSDCFKTPAPTPNIKVELTLRYSKGEEQSQDNKLKFSIAPYLANTGRNLGRVKPPETDGFFAKIEIKGIISPSGLDKETTKGLVFKQIYTDKVVRNGMVIYERTNEPDHPDLEVQQLVPTNDQIFMIDAPGYGTSEVSGSYVSFTQRVNFTTWVEQNGKKVSNDLKWYERTTLKAVSGKWVEQVPTDVGEGHITIDN